jgi:hypothetical protein
MLMYQLYFGKEQCKTTALIPVPEMQTSTLSAFHPEMYESLSLLESVSESSRQT